MGVCWTRVAAKSSELSGLMRSYLSVSMISARTAYTLRDHARPPKKFGGGGGALHRPLFDPARLGGTGKAGAGS